MNRNRLFPLIALMLTAALLLCSCSGEETEEYGEIKKGESMRDFTATLTDGSSFTLSDHKGKVIFLNFWATWCGPCVQEMPDIQALFDAYSTEEVAVIGVNCGEDTETVSAFLQKGGFSYPIALDEDLAISAKYPSRGIPYTLVIDPEGTVSEIMLGSLPEGMYDIFTAAIDAALEG